jgi:methylated-DNA-[protein]-cysteine S-methyltransferase
MEASMISQAALMPIAERPMREKPLERLFLGRLATPIGQALLISDDEELLRLLDWQDHEERMLVILRRRYGAVRLAERPAPDRIRRPLERYFEGELRALSEVPFRSEGTPFQLSVWDALTKIPVGETTSYGALAERIGKASAVRAVGLANGANPISVVVPCHRVIGSDGSLTGYGGGLERKRWLLRHEGALPEIELAL